MAPGAVRLAVDPGRARDGYAAAVVAQRHHRDAELDAPTQGLVEGGQPGNLRFRGVPVDEHDHPGLAGYDLEAAVLGRPAQRPSAYEQPVACGDQLAESGAGCAEVHRDGPA